MNRLHVHLKVKDLDQSIGFYSTLFGRAPDKREPDYAKWMLDNPRANIAISTKGENLGVDHIGIETEAAADLGAIAARLSGGGVAMIEEAGANCCYARSDKFWTASPDGARWELFHTVGESDTFGEEASLAALETAAASSCCAPR